MASFFLRIWEANESDLWVIKCDWNSTNFNKIFPMMRHMFKLMSIKNQRKNISRWYSLSINVLIPPISRRLRTLLNQKRCGTFLRNVMLVMTNSRNMIYKHWEDNSSYWSMRIMRRMLNILIGSHDTNHMKSYGEVFSDQTVVNKVICILSIRLTIMRCQLTK